MPAVHKLLFTASVKRFINSLLNMSVLRLQRTSHKNLKVKFFYCQSVSMFYTSSELLYSFFIKSVIMTFHESFVQLLKNDGKVTARRFVITNPGSRLTTLHFLPNLRMGPIS
jgi:hypothetical protein